MTDAWDPSNPEHKEIAHGIEVRFLIYDSTFIDSVHRLETVFPRCETWPPLAALLKLLVSRLSTKRIWPTVSYSEMNLAFLTFNN